MMDWQDIESAPKDGTLFIALLHDGEVRRVRWSVKYEPHSWADADEFYAKPVGWMPLPDPPASPRSGEGA